MTRLAFRLATAGALALAALIAAPATDAPAKKLPTLHVANNGVDSGACGAADDPCRSISQAIANAPVTGARIEVGPGIYGDLDRDGALGETGEEFAPSGCYCLVLVDKPVAIVSRDGPALTLIDGAGASLSLVRIEADGAVFGSSRKGVGQGFTLMGGYTGALVWGASDVLVAGNVSVGNASGGFVEEGPSELTVFHGNLAVANGTSGFYAGESNRGTQLLENVAIANGVFGFDSTSDESTLVGNVALANAVHGFGFNLRDRSTFALGNAAIGNGLDGFSLGPAVDSGGSAVISRGSAIGNVGEGIDSRVPGDYTRNNLFGNSPPDGCGFFERGAGSDASRSFWGGPGPGSDPADQVCGDVTADRPARRELRLKLRNLPLQ